MYSDMDRGALPPRSFLIRRSSDQGFIAASRSLSQLYTSFIGFWCQGIHRLLLVALPIHYYLGYFYTTEIFIFLLCSCQGAKIKSILIIIKFLFYF